MDQIILYAYSFLWFLTIIIYVKKRKKAGDVFGVGEVILLSYFVYSIFSILLCGSSYFNASIKVTVFPFIYLYGIELLFLLPLLRYHSSKTQLCHPTDLLLFNIISAIFIISSLIHLPSVITSFREGLFQILSDSSGGADLYTEEMERSYESGGGITNLFAIFSSAFSGLGTLFLFYSFVNKKISKWIRAGLLLSYMVILLNGES